MIKRFSQITDSTIREINSLIGQEKYKYKFLLDSLEKVRLGDYPFYDLWIISDNQKKWIIGFLTVNYLLFGENWTAKQLKEASHIVKPERFKNYHLSGTRDLIEEFQIINNQIPFEEFKNRNFYKAQKPKHFRKNELIIRVGNSVDIDELGQMRVDYYSYEYPERPKKQFQDMVSLVKSELASNKIYVVTNQDNIIAGFCTILELNIIGTLYIKEQFRNKDYGKSLLSFVSENLVKLYRKCYLMIDSKNISSNRVVEFIGFERIYEYSDIVINNCG